MVSGHQSRGLTDSPLSSVITDAACVALFETKVIVVRMNGDVVEHNLKVPVGPVDRMARTTPRERSRLARPGDQMAKPGDQSQDEADDDFQPGDS